jgi:hypothetical protein
MGFALKDFILTLQKQILGFIFFFFTELYVQTKNQKSNFKISNISENILTGYILGAQCF